MDPIVFGAFIQTRRKELGMNQTQLADKLHVTAKAVSRWERGVGFPDIKLLQPLADALEITIAELMQSRLLEKDLPKEEAAQLVTKTVETIRQQEALSWKRKRILYGGYIVFFMIYIFLYMVGMELRFESWWTGTGVSCVAVVIWHFCSRALYSLITGAPFFEQPPKKRWQYYAAIAVFLSAVIVILLAMSCISNKSLRDFFAIAGLMLAFICGCYLTTFEEELNK